MSRSRATSLISRLLHHQYRHQNPNSLLRPLQQWSYPISTSSDRGGGGDTGSTSDIIDSAATSAIHELLAEVEREKTRERDARKKAGEVEDEDEEEEDFMRVGPLIDKLEKTIFKDHPSLDEPTDSDSEEDDEDYDNDDDIGNTDVFKVQEQYDNKCKRHKLLLDQYINSESLDDSFKLMDKLRKFQQKHFNLRPEYRVIGELMNRLKVSTGKDKFMLTLKLNRAIRLLDWKETFDPNNPANYGVIQMDQMGSSEDMIANLGFQREKRLVQGGVDGDDDDFDDMKERDNILIQKLNEIDAKLEEKLSELEYTFGKKGKRLEEEIRDLAEERNSLQEKKRMPLYRKGFDARLVDVNRTCKVTKGGQVVKYTAIMACGNYHGAVGFAKAKGPAVSIAIQKAYEKCFQNLHYVDLYEDHTIAHAIQTSYKKTKIYLWPAKKITGMTAGRTVELILKLVGFKNIKSKVIGSRNPYNTVKAVFKALNSIESPKDVQEKFGRTVVESYLL